VRLISFDPVQRLNEDSGKIIEPRREPNWCIRTYEVLETLRCRTATQRQRPE
jgi:hypothetical protein